MGAVELDSIAKVCEFDRWLAAGAVGHQQVLRLGGEIKASPLVIHTNMLLSEKFDSTLVSVW